MKEYNLQRFVIAQKSGYQTALSEIRKGRKRGHWIWYIFPQFKKFAHSHIAEYYGIEGKDEAEVYLQHPILGQRIREISDALLLHKGKDIKDIFGELDAGKVRSCMTMFDYFSPNDVFAQVLDAFYGGERGGRTLKVLTRNEGIVFEKKETTIKPPKVFFTCYLIICLIFLLGCKDYKKHIQEEECNQFVDCPMCNGTGVFHYLIEEIDSTCVGCNGTGSCDPTTSKKVLNADKEVRELCNTILNECRGSERKMRPDAYSKMIHYANEKLHNMEQECEHTNDKVERAYLPRLIAQLKSCIRQCKMSEKGKNNN